MDDGRVSEQAEHEEQVAAAVVPPSLALPHLLQQETRGG